MKKIFLTPVIINCVGIDTQLPARYIRDRQM